MVPTIVPLWISELLLAVSIPPLLVYAVRLYLFSALSLRHGKPAPSIHRDDSRHMVSVIIPLFNKAVFVDRLMSKVTSFYGPDFEVIVADDSHDSSPEKLEKWREDPRVTAVYRPTRRGWKAGALNEAIKAVSLHSEYCLFLDADSVPEADLLQRMVVRMEETGADVVQGAQQPDANDPQNWVSRGLALVLNGFNFVDLQARKELGLLIPVTGSNFLIRTELIKANPFHENASEDWELTAELWSRGWKVVYAPDIIVRGEAPDRVRGMLKRYALWSGSTTADTVNLAGEIARSRNLKRRVKLDFFLSGLSYLMSIFVILAVVGALLIPVPIFGRGSTPIIAGSAILAAFIIPAAPISLLVAAHVSNTKRRLSSVLLAILGSLLVLPVVAYSSLKGLVRHGRPLNVKTDAGFVDVNEIEAESQDQA